MIASTIPSVGPLTFCRDVGEKVDVDQDEGHTEDGVPNTRKTPAVQEDRTCKESIGESKGRTTYPSSCLRQAQDRRPLCAEGREQGDRRQAEIEDEATDLFELVGVLESKLDARYD